jgi:hypothetical protein
MIAEQLEHPHNLASAVSNVVVGDDYAIVASRPDASHHSGDLPVGRLYRGPDVPNERRPRRRMLLEHVLTRSVDYDDLVTCPAQPAQITRQRTRLRVLRSNRQ